MPPKGAAKKAAVKAEEGLTEDQKSALTKSRSLLDAATRVGVLASEKPDQYPRLAPSKGGQRRDRGRYCWRRHEESHGGPESASASSSRGRALPRSLLTPMLPRTRVLSGTPFRRPAGVLRP